MARRKAPHIPDAILDQLLAGADAKTAFDPNGLLDHLKKALAERALNAEMDHHLASDDVGNSRNGYSRKTVTTETGRLDLEVPRDRQSTFDPMLIAKYQRRFPGFDDKIVSMYARGMSTREIGGEAFEGARGRERQAEAASGRRYARQCRVEGSSHKKCMVRPVGARISFVLTVPVCINVSGLSRVDRCCGQAMMRSARDRSRINGSGCEARFFAQSLRCADRLSRHHSPEPRSWSRASFRLSPAGAARRLRPAW